MMITMLARFGRVSVWLAAALGGLFLTAGMAARADSAAPELVPQIGQSSRAESIAISLDKRLLVTAQQNGIVTVWDLPTGVVLRSFNAGGPAGVAISQDSRVLAVANSLSNRVYLYDLMSWNVIRVLAEDSNASDMAFSPDGKILALTSGRSVSLWNYRTGRLLRSFTIHTDFSTAVFSPDGTTLATGGRWDGGDKRIEFWNPLSGILRGNIDTESEVHSFAFSPDGKTIALGTGRWAETAMTVELRDVTSRKKIRSFAPDEKYVNGVAFSPNGASLTTVNDAGDVHLWDVATGKLLRSAKGGDSNGEMSPVCISKDARLAVITKNDGSLAICDVGAGARAVRTIPGNPVDMQSLAFSNDGKSLFLFGMLSLASGFNKDNAQIIEWDMRTGQLKNQVVESDRAANWTERGDLFEQHPNPIVSGGRRLAASGGGTGSWIWDPDKGTMRRVPTVDKGRGIDAFALSRDGSRIAIVGSTWKPNPKPNGPIMVNPSVLEDLKLPPFLEVYETRTGRRLCSVPFFGKSTGVLQFTPDGKTVMSASENWDIWDNPQRFYTTRFGPVFGLLQFWTAETGALLSTIGIDGWSFISLSRDGTKVLAWKRGSITVFDRKSGRILRTLNYPGGSLDLSLNGRLLLATGSDGVAGIWDAATGRRLRALEGGANCGGARFSPDGHTVACLDSNGSVRLWNADTGRKRATLLLAAKTGGTPHMEWLAYTPDGYYDGSPGVAQFLSWRVGRAIVTTPKLAVKYRRPDLVQIALTGKPQPTIHAQLAKREAALQSAVQREVNVIVAQMAAKAKADQAAWDERCKGSYTPPPLVEFSSAGNVEEVKKLLAGTDKAIVIKNDGEAALLGAAYAEHDDIVQILLDAGADFKDDSGHSLVALKGNRPALSAALRNLFDGKSLKGMQTVPDLVGTACLLLRMGADPDVRDDEGRTVMMHASYDDGYEPLFAAMLAHGADVNARDNEGKTALALYSGCGHSDSVRFLLEHGARTEIATKFGFTPLLWASQNGYLETVQLLLAHGADPNAQADPAHDGWTSLTVAATGGHLAIMRELLAHGALVNGAAKSHRNTALSHAVERLDDSMVRLLLEHGADINARSWDDKTLFQVLQENDPEDRYGIAALLKAAATQARNNPAIKGENR